MFLQCYMYRVPKWNYIFVVDKAVLNDISNIPQTAYNTREYFYAIEVRRLSLHECVKTSVIPWKYKWTYILACYRKISHQTLGPLRVNYYDVGSCQLVDEMSSEMIALNDG